MGLVVALAHCSSDDVDTELTPDSGTVDTGTSDSTKDAGHGDTTTKDSGKPDDTTDSGVGDDSKTISGLVTAAAFVPGSATEPTVKAGYFSGAKVCVDANEDGKCGADENPVTTDASGAFTLKVANLAGIIADIGTDATNTASNAKNPSRNVFRASLEQVTEQGSKIVLDSLSTEVVRMMEDNGTTYAAEKQNLATRLSGGNVTVKVDQVLSDSSTLTDSTKQAVLVEANILQNRFQYAITKYDRKDLYPDALATPGGNPELTGLSGVSPGTATTPETRQPITFKQAQQAAFNVEAIPRYDHIFIVMLENKGTVSILNSPYAPKINGYLSTGNQAANYFATGNPSEPNYTALGGGDDFGITDDSQWNCDATGPNAPTDAFIPDNSHPGLASSPFAATCTQHSAVHNIVGRPNLFTSLSSRGMTWRTYNESMNPGQDPRTDSVTDPGVTAQDYVYPAGTLNGNAASIGDPNLVLPMPAGLYKTKHHPGMAYDAVRNAPEFTYSNRTVGGGQWDSAMMQSTRYAVPAGYDVDQLGTDLDTGNIGNLNFVIPDQCDDMHSITVKGTTTGGATGTASDCGGNNIITRGDNYVDYLVKKIQASALWKNKQRRIAIVLMFDEGTATTDSNSCCGWKASKTTENGPLNQNADGTYNLDQDVASYANGNKGHGNSVFGVLTNQDNAPKGVVDSDVYSHFSLVRTIQDMFQVSDPADDSTYMNRSKYTEKFIAKNLANLQEYAGSADTHFDSVRPMNHTFVLPASYTGKQASDNSRPPQTGPDGSQKNIWAVK